MAARLEDRSPIYFGTSERNRRGKITAIRCRHCNEFLAVAASAAAAERFARFKGWSATRGPRRKLQRYTCERCNERIRQSIDSMVKGRRRRPGRTWLLAEIIMEKIPARFAVAFGEIAQEVRDDYGAVTDRRLHRHLSRLIEEGFLERSGNPNHYQYRRIRTWESRVNL